MWAGRKGWRSSVLNSWPAAPVVIVSNARKVRILKFGLTIGRQRVRCWLVAVVPVLALLICGKLAPQVVRLLVLRVLEVVFSVGARLPDVDDCVGDALLGVQIHDYTVHESLLALGVLIADNAVTELAEGRVW
jgi:hypothetical protein